MRNKRLIFGITGGSGSGKTSVSAILSELGVHIVDTDIIAHKVTEKGTECLRELEEYFGSEIILSGGLLDRKKLASIAFSDDKKTMHLNRITHKHIKDCVLEEIEKSSADIIAIDGAVIIGSNIEPLCEFIVSVIAKKDIRLERIKKRDDISDKQAIERLNAQPDDSFYMENSKYIIYNNGDSEELRKNVNAVYSKIKEV
ncbi:MAG: dephospho-CoA kinase [Clostridia bacterium]|nr:dephospho-CoA kinase [Clostridia bacterium]